MWGQPSFGRLGKALQRPEPRRWAAEETEGRNAKERVKGFPEVSQSQTVSE